MSTKQVKVVYYDGTKTVIRPCTIGLHQPLVKSLNKIPFKKQMQNNYFAAIGVCHQQRYIKIYNSNTTGLANHEVEMVFTFHNDMKAFLPINEWSKFTNVRMTEDMAVELYAEMNKAYLGIKKRMFERYRDQFVSCFNI